MGYQNGPGHMTLTADGQPVEWVVCFETKTVTVKVNGETLGTWRCHTAAKQALGLIDVPMVKKGRKAA